MDTGAEQSFLIIILVCFSLGTLLYIIKRVLSVDKKVTELETHVRGLNARGGLSSEIEKLREWRYGLADYLTKWQASETESRHDLHREFIKLRADVYRILGKDTPR